MQTGGRTDTLALALKISCTNESAEVSWPTEDSGRAAGALPLVAAVEGVDIFGERPGEDEGEEDKMSVENRSVTHPDLVIEPSQVHACKSTEHASDSSNALASSHNRTSLRALRQIMMHIQGDALSNAENRLASMQRVKGSAGASAGARAPHS